MVPKLQLFLYPPPCFSRPDHLRLKHGLRISSFISIYAHHTFPLSSPCQCTTPHIQLECSWPDAWVPPVQVPAWDLVQAAQNQGWGMLWLSTLHPGKGGLCSYGLLGPSRWGPQMKSTEIPQLHQEHPRQWDLPMSPCLWTGGCQEEVWQICQWTRRQDMPTCLLCADRQW